MKILFPNFGSVCRKDIQETFISMGHEVIHFTDEPQSYSSDTTYTSNLHQFILSQKPDIVFTNDYFPVVSDACHDAGVLYISWCFDSPLVLLYSPSVFHSCNRIFLFDSQMVINIQNLGVKDVYYLPMAVNTARLDKLSASKDQLDILTADVAFVGALYDEKHNLYDRYKEKMDDFTRGYMESIMQAQRRIYGYFLLEEALNESIMTRLLEQIPLPTDPEGFESPEYIFANYYLCRKIAQMDRHDMLTALDQRTDLKVRLYTPNPTPQYTHVQNLGTVQYQEEMPLVFRHSRINLNLALRSIQNGIPLRAMDIMGAGGFLLTNHQNDFSLHFTQGKEYVCYENLDDMIQKIDYYLQHEDERQAIAKNGHAAICQDHTYEKRLKEMLSVLNL